MFKNKKMAAFTIIESMTAMLIIVIVFSLGFMIFNTVLSTNNIVARQQAMFVMEEVMAESLEALDFKEQTFEKNGLIIYKKIEHSPFKKDCFIVKLIANDFFGKDLGQLKRIYCEN